MKRVALVALGLTTACDSAATRRRGGGEERVRIEQVRQSDVADRVLLTGSLHATSAEELRVPRTSTWQLPIRWMAEDGESIKQGARALEFDTSSFMKDLAQHRLQYLDAVIVFRTFQNMSTLELAQKEFELATHKIVLAKAKVLAEVPADLLAARTAQERRLELKRAEAQVAKAEKELASARAAAALERQVKQIELDKARNTIEDAEKAIGELTLAAPRDGTAVIGDHPWTGRKFQVGDVVQPGWTIISLPDRGSGMEVRAELSDVDDGRVSVGTTGRCTLDAYPDEPLPCSVKTLMQVASGQGGKSLRRGFALVLALEKFDAERMRPGMSVKIDLRRPPLAGGLVVPRGAVRFTDGKVFVKLAGGQLREVELGPCDAQNCAVIGGLAAGEQVAIGGSS